MPPTQDHANAEQATKEISRRVGELDLTVAEILTRTASHGDGGPVSQSTYHNLRSSTQHLLAARHATLYKLDHALNWEPGSIATMLEGGDPTEKTPRPDGDLEGLLGVLIDEMRLLRGAIEGSLGDGQGRSDS